MSMLKYRLKEVAADFSVAPKEITEIISKYYEKPKSNTQVLTEEELNVVFDYMTSHNQIASLEQVFQAQAKAAPKQEKPVRLPSPRRRSPRSRRRSLPSPRSRNGSGSAGWWTPLRCR